MYPLCKEFSRGSTFKEHEYGGAAIGHNFGIAAETGFFVLHQQVFRGNCA
jgi:hypothetical protein